MRIARLAVVAASLTTLTTLPALALEYPIGAPKEVNGLEVAAVYLQPIDMEPPGHMRKASESDIHLEADNVKLKGPGKYKVKFTVYPPGDAGNPHGAHFGRHTDRATGVGAWFKPFSVEWDFTYAGIGKKGGY